MSMTLHIYRTRRFQRAWFGMHRSGVCRVREPEISRETFSRPWVCPLRPIGKISCRYTSPGQDGSNDHNFEWIGPVVSDVWHPLNLGRKKGRTNERMENIVTFFPLKGGWGWGWRRVGAKLHPIFKKIGIHLESNRGQYSTYGRQDRRTDAGDDKTLPAFGSGHEHRRLSFRARLRDYISELCGTYTQ